MSPSGFDRFAGWASRLVSRAGFFTVSALLVVLWVPTILVFHSVDTWQLVLNTVTSVFAFLLIALLQNSERRNDRALHAKLDRIADVLAEVAERSDDPAMARAARELRSGRGLERRVSTD